MWVLCNILNLSLISSIYYGPQHPPCLVVGSDSLFPQRLFSIQLKFINHNQTFIPYFDISISSQDVHQKSWYSVLPSLDATISCRIKKAVVGVAQLITALVSIHSSMIFLVDMYSFLDPPGRMVLFSVDDRSLFSSRLCDWLDSHGR